ncbi:MAG: hypothetical protein JRD89_00045 [Deltaproteobacteria bacterium]|nr:hypothetical protein [Deltaproteobacteria bacterium]
MVPETRLIEIANDIVKIACGRKFWPDNWSSVTSAKLAKRMISLVTSSYSNDPASAHHPAHPSFEPIAFSCDVDNKAIDDELVLAFPALHMALTFFCSNAGLNDLLIDFAPYPHSASTLDGSSFFYIDFEDGQVINYFEQNAIPDHVLSLYTLVLPPKKGKFIEIIRYCCKLTGDERLKEGYERIIKFGDIGS